MAECEAHRFVMSYVEDLRKVTESLSDHQREHKETIVKLTENLLELQRFNIHVLEALKELKDYNVVQDGKTNKNEKFAIKISAVIGFLVVASPIIGWLLKH